MKKDNNFWVGLEEYFRVVVKRNPIPYPWLALGIILMVVVASIVNSSSSFASVSNLSEAASRAANLGDYETASELFTKLNSQDSVLGVQSTLEDTIYPERVLEKRVAELEQKIIEYPGNREIFLELSSLYEQLDNRELADEYREKARVLDPNEVKF